jgi:starch synthase
MESDNPIHIIGELGGHAALPPCKIGRMDLKDGLVIYVLICPELYEREGTPYGANNGRDWPDNHIRFARLGLAAADMAANLAQIHWVPGPGACPRLARRPGPPPICTGVGHAHRPCSPSTTWRTRAWSAWPPRRSWAFRPMRCNRKGMEFYGKMSFLKAGMAYSSHITTVSATYAQEITTPEFGCGLDGFLASKTQQGLLSGIPNGIDESWEASTDTHLTPQLQYRRLGRQGGQRRPRAQPVWPA